MQHSAGTNKSLRRGYCRALSFIQMSQMYVSLNKRLQNHVTPPHYKVTVVLLTRRQSRAYSARRSRARFEAARRVVNRGITISKKLASKIAYRCQILTYLVLIRKIGDFRNINKVSHLSESWRHNMTPSVMTPKVLIIYNFRFNPW